MGCDIHCYVEKKIDGKWQQIKGFVSDYYDPESDYFSTDRFRNVPSPFDRRNYSMFSIMAGVRNGYGFAGCDTGNPIVPISEPKGLPDDVSQEVRQESDDWGIDGHTHSWLTVQEIMDYDASKTKIHRGWVTVEGYKKFLETGDPYPCSGDVWGENVTKVNKDFAIEYQDKHPEEHVYCQIEWQTTMAECAPNLFGDGLNSLKERCETSDFSDVRIVFWFDN